MKNKLLLVLILLVFSLFAFSSPVQNTLAELLLEDYIYPQSAAVINSISSDNKAELNKEKIKSERIRVVTILNNELLKNTKIATSTKVYDNSVEGKVALENILKNNVKQRKELMLKMVKDDPISFLNLSLPQSEKAKLPVAIQNDIESHSTITGKIEVTHVDDFEKRENDYFMYSIQSGGKETKVYFTTPLIMSSGATIKIKGVSIDNLMAANVQDVVVIAKAGIPDSVGDQKSLVLLIKHSGESNDFTREQAQDLVFNSQFNNFYKEQSYDKVSFSGDVLDWITIPADPFATGACGAADLTTREVSSAISSQNIDLGKYERLIFLVNDTWGGCSGVGKWSRDFNGNTYSFSLSWIGTYNFNSPAYVGEMPFEWTNLDYILSHELGHGLGVLHANGFDCYTNSFGDESKCNHLEYGNIYDTMGSSNGSLHFNAFYKELLQWIEPSDSLDIKTSGTYSINPLELASSLKKFAKVSVAGLSTAPFYIEYRQGIGFDENLNQDNLASNQSGLFVNNVVSSEYGFRPFTRLLDMSPTDLDWYEDIENVTLNKGLDVEGNSRVFKDEGSGVTIGPVLSATSTNITFDVKIETPVCVRRNPSVHDNRSIFGVVGSKIYNSVLVTNNNSVHCDPSMHSLSFVGPSSWTFEKENVLIPSGQEGYMPFILTPPANTPPGTYKIEFDVIGKGQTKTRFSADVGIVPPVVIDSISPAKAPVGSEVTLTGSGFTGSKDLSAIISSANLFTNVPIRVVGDTTAKFTVPNSAFDKGCQCIKELTRGYYLVQVYNNELISNFATFGITVPTTSATSTATSTKPSLFQINNLIKKIK